MKRRVVNKSDNFEEAGSLTAPSRHSTNGTTAAKKTSSKALISIFLIIIGALVGFITHQKQHYEEVQKVEIEKVRMEAKSAYEEKERALESHIEASDKERQTSEKDLNNQLLEMKEKVNILESDLKASDERRLKLEEEMKEAEEDTKVNDLVMQQIEHLRQEIQRRDRHAVLEKFGEGPHHLEFTLDFPPEEIPEGTADTFIIEMAPIDLVSIEKFLIVFGNHDCFIHSS